MTCAVSHSKLLTKGGEEQGLPTGDEKVKEAKSAA